MEVNLLKTKSCQKEIYILYYKICFIYSKKKDFYSKLLKII